MECIDIERSIIKKYRKCLWGRFVRAINDYEMISEGDKIAVCISGGKDSFLLAKLMQELKKHGRVNFDLEFICMNPGYKKEHLDNILENAKHLEIPLHIFESNIFEVTKKDLKPCYLCARMRRGYLYAEAQKLGCNKIALGHHFNDVIETILMSMIYNGEFKTMMPKLDATNFKGMKLIRPMYYIKEEDILAFCRNSELEFINCACAFSEKKDNDSKREVMKNLSKELVKLYKNADINIMNSAKNVNLRTIISYVDTEE